MPISVVLVYVMIYSGTAPIIILAMRLERRLQFHGDSLAVTFARIHLKPLMAGRVSVETPDTEGLLNLDKNPSRRWLWQRVPIVLYAVTMIQIGLAILSLTVYHYRFM
jgi:hypothetical protein